MTEHEEMRAVVVREPGGPDVLEFGRVPVPRYGAEEMLVRVRATALNRADLLQREGRYPPPEGASPVLGLEMAGEVEAVGDECEPWREGDRVFGLLAGGGYAEFAVIHRDMAVRLPASMLYEDGAAIPEVFLTAYQAVHEYGRAGKGSSILIHAGASGVGTAAIQLAREAGAKIFITASAGKHDACLRLGADLAIDYHSEDFAERVARATGGRGVDVVIDFIGAPYLDRNVASLAMDGRLILLATLGGSVVNGIDLRTLFAKRASVIASTLRNRGREYKIRLTRDFTSLALPLFERGALSPVIDRIVPWTDVVAAHRLMGDNRNIGKIVMKVT